MADLLVKTTDRSGPTVSVANRLRRLIWGIVYSVLFRPSPRIAHSWRAGILRLFGAKIGKKVHVYPKAKIWAPWNLEIDDECGVGDDATLYSMDKIKLGLRSVVSQGAYLCCGTHDYNSPTMQLITKPITICDDAWICAEAFIFPGVTVGEGGVAGARAVVTKDIPEWTVWAGNPCVLRGTRKRHNLPKA